MGLIRLNEDFYLSGTDIDEFYSALYEIDQSTVFRVVPKDSIEIWSYLGKEDEIKRKRQKDPDYMPEDGAKERIVHIFQRGVPGCVDCGSGSAAVMKPAFWRTSLRSDFLSKSLAGTGLDNELMLNGYMLVVNDRSIYVSPRFIETFAVRLGVTGQAVRQQDEYRDRFLVSCLTRQADDLTLVTRVDEKNHSKAFAAHSGNYQAFPQLALKTVAEAARDQFGHMDCRRWGMNHFLTEAELLFPNKADELKAEYGIQKSGIPEIEEMQPGLRISTSDTGEMSFSAQLYWLWKGEPIVTHTYKRMHRGNAPSGKELAEAVIENTLSRAACLPEILAALLGSGRLKDSDALVAKVASTSFDGKPSLRSLMGKKLCDAYLEFALKSPESRTTLTAFDAASVIMSIPSRIAESGKYEEWMMRETQEACGRAVIGLASMVR